MVYRALADLGDTSLPLPKHPSHLNTQTFIQPFCPFGFLDLVFLLTGPVHRLVPPWDTLPCFPYLILQVQEALLDYSPLLLQFISSKQSPAATTSFLFLPHREEEFSFSRIYWPGQHLA